VTTYIDPETNSLAYLAVWGVYDSGGTILMTSYSLGNPFNWSTPVAANLGYNITEMSLHCTSSKCAMFLLYNQINHGKFTADLSFRGTSWVHHRTGIALPNMAWNTREKPSLADHPSGWIIGIYGITFFSTSYPPTGYTVYQI